MTEEDIWAPKFDLIEVLEEQNPDQLTWNIPADDTDNESNESCGEQPDDLMSRLNTAAQVKPYQNSKPVDLIKQIPTADDILDNSLVERSAEITNMLKEYKKETTSDNGTAPFSNYSPPNGRNKEKVIPGASGPIFMDEEYFKLYPKKKKKDGDSRNSTNLIYCTPKELYNMKRGQHKKK